MKDNKTKNKNSDDYVKYDLWESFKFGVGFTIGVFAVLIVLTVLLYLVLSI